MKLFIILFSSMFFSNACFSNTINEKKELKDFEFKSRILITTSNSNRDFNYVHFDGYIENAPNCYLSMYLAKEVNEDSNLQKLKAIMIANNPDQLLVENIKITNADFTSIHSTSGEMIQNGVIFGNSTIEGLPFVLNLTCSLGNMFFPKVTFKVMKQMISENAKIEIKQ